MIPTRGAAAAFAAGTVAGTTMFVTRVGPSLKNGDFLTRNFITKCLLFYNIPPSNLVIESFLANSKYIYSNCTETEKIKLLWIDLVTPTILRRHSKPGLPEGF